ncbi:MAG: proteasome subunit beta [Halobacteriales archaeon]
MEPRTAPHQSIERPTPGLRDPDTPAVGSHPRSDPPADAEYSSETGTTTIGLTTADGVVLATDMRATLAGRFVTNKNVQKVEQIHPTAALTMVGSVGGAQAFVRGLRVESNLYETRRGERMSMQALSTIAGNFARAGPYWAINPILGGVDHEGSHVFSIAPDGGVLGEDYVVTGSGMQLAYGHLEQKYDPDISTDEAIRVAAGGVVSATERDSGSGNGIYIATVTEEGVDIEGHKNVDALL